MTCMRGRGVAKASPAISFHLYETPASASQIMILVANLLVKQISTTYMKGQGVLKASPAISFHLHKTPVSA